MILLGLESRIARACGYGRGAIYTLPARASTHSSHNARVGKERLSTAIQTIEWKAMFYTISGDDYRTTVLLCCGIRHASRTKSRTGRSVAKKLLGGSGLAKVFLTDHNILAEIISFSKQKVNCRDPEKE